MRKILLLFLFTGIYITYSQEKNVKNTMRKEVNRTLDTLKVTKENKYQKNRVYKDSTSIKKKKSNFWKKVRFGGGLGLGFGNNSTTVAISPTAIYDFNDRFSLGLGIGYQYSKRRDIRSNIYSLSALSLYNPTREVQLSAEFEQLFTNQRSNKETYNNTIPSLYIGAAYAVSRNISMGIRYDVLFDKNNSIYDSAFSPIFRVFF